VLKQIANGEPFTTVAWSDTDSDGYHWVEAHGKPYIDAQDNLDGMIVSIRVIDEQVEAERLREADRQRAVAAEARYRLLADNAVDVITHLRGREVVWISPSVQAAFGWPAEAWIGADFSARIHPDDLDVVASALETIAGGQSATARRRVATAAGDYHWVECRGKPYRDAQGNNTDGMIRPLPSGLGGQRPTGTWRPRPLPATAGWSRSPSCWTG